MELKFGESLAELVELLICNQKNDGSCRSGGFIFKNPTA